MRPFLVPNTTTLLCRSLAVLDLNYLEETAGGPDLTVATLPKSGKIVFIQV